jgi:acyl carrier protein
MDRQPPLASVLPEVQRAVSAILGGPDVESGQPLVEAGLDSIGAIQLRDSLADVFAIDLPTTVVYDYPTIASIADFIASSRRDRHAATKHSLIESMSSSFVGVTTSVTGFSARFPRCESDGIAGFWDAVRTEKDVPTLVPLERWDIESCYSPDMGTLMSMYVRFGGFVRGEDLFDAQAFRFVWHSTQCDQ